MKILNPKSEILSKSKTQNSNVQKKVLNFGYLDFEFIWNLALGI
jgi:hypothetical protein